MYIITLLILFLLKTHGFSMRPHLPVHTTTSIHRFHRKRIRCREWGQFKTEAYLIAVTVKTEPFENVYSFASLVNTQRWLQCCLCISTFSSLWVWTERDCENVSWVEANHLTRIIVPESHSFLEHISMDGAYEALIMKKCLFFSPFTLITIMPTLVPFPSAKILEIYFRNGKIRKLLNFRKSKYSMENSGNPQTKPNGTEIFELLGIGCSRGCPLFRTMLFRSLEEISKNFSLNGKRSLLTLKMPL